MQIYHSDRFIILIVMQDNILVTEDNGQGLYAYSVLTIHMISLSPLYLCLYNVIQTHSSVMWD